MDSHPNPTDRELEILKILWDRKEATVREVYEQLSDKLGIVQNTVQAFLRTMEQKDLVEHRLEGRTFIYRPKVGKDATSRSLVSRLLHRVFDGAMDELVQSALSVRPPKQDELANLDDLIEHHKSSKSKSSNALKGKK